MLKCKIRRCGGTGRRPGLKIPWVAIPVPVRSRSPAPKKAPFKGAFFGADFRIDPPFRRKGRDSRSRCKGAIAFADGEVGSCACDRCRWQIKGAGQQLQQHEKSRANNGLRWICRCCKGELMRRERVCKVSGRVKTGAVGKSRERTVTGHQLQICRNIQPSTLQGCFFIFVLKV